MLAPFVAMPFAPFVASTAEASEIQSEVSFGSVLSLLLAGCLGRYCLQLLKDQFHSLKKNQTFIEQLQGRLLDHDTRQLVLLLAFPASAATAVWMQGC